MGDLPSPSFTTTYCRADGEPIAGEYGWVIHAEFFEDIDEPVDVIVETWERTRAEVVTFKPSWWVEDPCENCGESIAAHTDDDGAECWVEAVNGSEARRRTRATGQRPTEGSGG